MASTEERPRPAAGRRVDHGLDDRVAIVAVTLVAALIRLPTLTTQSFWLDEAYTERLIRMGFGSMLHAIPQTESTPPLYYAAAWVWTRAFGDSEVGLRSLSALAGIVTIPVAYLVAQRLAGRRAGAIAGLLLAVSPLMAWFSQEARAYALATLLATVTLLCLVGYLQHGRRRWLAGWAASAALGLATHYFVAFVIAPEVLWLVWRRRAGWSAELSGALVLVGAVGVALVPLAVTQRGTGHADYIAQGSLAQRIVQLPKQLLVGYASPGQVVTGVIAALLVLVGAVLALLAVGDARRRASLPLAVGLGAVLTPIVLALVGVDFLNTRNVLVALPPLTVAAAIGFDRDAASPFGSACAGLLALIAVVVIVLVDANPRFQRDDWRGVSQALGSPSGARAIVVSPGSGLIALSPYERGLSVLGAPATVTELDIVAVPHQVTGGGIGIPPRPAGPLPVPAGMHLFERVQTSTYTVLRYRRSTPVTVAPATAAADHLGPGTDAVLLQEG